MGSRAARGWGMAPGLVLAFLCYLALGNDGRHHWHEWRYAYSAVHYSVSQLAAGEFDPGPPPERSPAEVGAWYWGQLFHEVILAALFRMTGTGLHAVRLVQLVYGLWVPLAVLAWYAALRRLSLAGSPGVTAAVLLASPLGCWMGFKLMAEAPAFFFASVSGLCLVVALRSATPYVRVGCMLGAGLGLALAFLTMVYMPLVVVGLLVAVAFVPPPGVRRITILGVGCAIALAFCVFVLGALRALGLSPKHYVQMYGFFLGYRKSWLVSLFGVATAWSALYLLVPIALWSHLRRDLGFFCAWLCAAIAPILIFSANYIEARFAVTALVPMAGLLGLAYRRIVDWTAPRLVATRRDAWTTVLGASLGAVVTAVTLPIMPFEMNSRELSGVVQRIYERSPNAALLIPWNYTDYHFLTLAYPHRDIMLVQAPVDEHGQAIHDEAWEQRRRETYGAHFAGNAADLARFSGRDLFYLGHGRLPPFQNLQTITNAVGLSFVSAQIAAMNPMVHIEHSWMWKNPEFAFTPVMQSRWYRVYQVHVSQ